jgi:CDP-glycerol glycerophosphotransferase (TagB/SpsB family)
LLSTEELLSKADIVITDYSSIYFTAKEIDIPVFIYSRDLEDYQESRGLSDSFLKLVKLDGFSSSTELFKKIESQCLTADDYVFESAGDGLYKFIKNVYSE